MHSSVARPLTCIPRIWKKTAMGNTGIISSLNKALEDLEEAFQAFENEKETELDRSLWKAFSEIEYTSFLVSLETGDNKVVERKRGRVYKIDMKTSLINAKDSLLDSLKLVKRDGLSNGVGDGLEEVKASVFDAIRKQSAKNRQQKTKGSPTRAPSSASP